MKAHLVPQLQAAPSPQRASQDGDRLLLSAKAQEVVKKSGYVPIDLE